MSRRTPPAADAPAALFVGADAQYMLDFRGPLIAACRARGYRPVVLATPTPGFDPSSLERLGADFIPWNLSQAALNPIGDIPALWRLWRTLRRLRCRLVFAHTIKAVIYAMILGRLANVPRRAAMIPGLGYAFTDSQTLKRRVVSWLARRAYALAFRCADVVLLQNPNDRDDLIAARVLRPTTEAVVVNGSGVDMARFADTPPSPGPPRFLMVARLIRDKGVYEFVEAARRVKAEIPEARFVLVGDVHVNPAAVSQQEIEAWREEGVVEVRGRLADPQPEYAACHVFVLPSYYREGTPRTNLEAMASARAVITTDMPGCRETVRHGVNGLLTPPRDPAALADAMLELARDPERMARMGAESRRLCAERFELAQVTATTLAHIEGRPREVIPTVLRPVSIVQKVAGRGI